MAIALLGLFLLNIIWCCCACCCRAPAKGRPKSVQNETYTVSEYSNQSKPSNNNEHDYDYSKYDQYVDYDADDDDYWDDSVYGGGLTRKLKKITVKSTFLRERQGFFCCCCHMVAVILIIAYAVGLILSVSFYFSAASEVIKILETKNETDADVELWVNGETETISLARSIQYGINNTVGFLMESVTKAGHDTNELIGEIDGLLKNNLDIGVRNIMDDTITNFNLTTIIEGGINVTMNYTYFANNVAYVSEQRNNTLNEAKKLNKPFIELHEKIVNACITKQCGTIENDSKDILRIEMPVNEFEIIPIFPNISEPVITFNESMQTLAGQLINLTKTLDNMKTELSTAIKQKINLTEMLAPLSDIWKEADTMIDSMSDKIESLTGPLPTYIEMAAPYAKLLLYALGALMIVIAIALVICVVLLIFEAFNRRLFTITGESASLIASSDYRKPKSRVCRSGCFCCTSLFFLILFVLLALLSTVCLVLTTLLAAELCPYIVNENGTKKTDFVIDGFLTGEWDSLVGDSLPKFVNLNQPKELLSTISITCGNPPEDLGLLAQLGMRKLINLTAVLEGPEIRDFVDKGKTTAIKEVLDVDINALLPDLSAMESLLENINTLVESLQWKEASELVNKILKPEDEFEKLKENLSNVTALKDVLPEFIEVNNKTQTTRQELIKLSNAYIGIDVGKYVFTQIKTLIDTVTELAAALDNPQKVNDNVGRPFDIRIKEVLTTLNTDGTEALDGFTDKLLPCKKLSLGLRAILLTPCGPSGLNPRFFAWSLLVTMTILFSFLCFVGLFNLWCIQNHQIKRFAKTESLNEVDLQ